MSTTWVYIAGPIIGATIAVGFELILKGNATAAGDAAALAALPERSTWIGSRLSIPNGLGFPFASSSH